MHQVFLTLDQIRSVKHFCSRSAEVASGLLSDSANRSARHLFSRSVGVALDFLDHSNSVSSSAEHLCSRLTEVASGPFDYSNSANKSETAAGLRKLHLVLLTAAILQVNLQGISAAGLQKM